MKIIDSHVHLYPPAVSRDPAAWAAAEGEMHWATLSTRRRRDGRPVQGFPGLDDLLRAMDAASVQRAILQGWYWNRPESCVAQNRFYADCIRAHPDRLSACGAFHPGLGEEGALAEVRRMKAEGFVGLGELSPHSQGYAVDDRIFRAVLTLAGELNFPVTLHVTDPDSRSYPGRVDTPLDDFVRLAGEYPQIHFILAHWGGLLPLRDLTAVTLANVYYDTAASPLLYDSTIWQRFSAAVGAGRILFGSDFPLNLYPKLDSDSAMIRLVDEARGAGLEPAKLDALLEGNAARLFRL